jgi:hypothetical protein
MGDQRTRRRRRLRPGKIITQAIVFLLLGAIVNVAMAGGCVFRPGRFHSPPGYEEGYTRQGPGYSDWFVMTSRAARFERIDSHWSTGAPRFTGVPPSKPAAELLPTYTDFGRPTEGYPGDTLVWRTTDARGWPFLCMWSGWEHIGPTTPGVIAGTVFDFSNGYLIPSDRTKPFSQWTALLVFPLAPIWSGFAVNTLSYAIVLWLLIAGPFVLRGLIRRRRGCCPKCGYDLRGALPGASCPECGWERESESAAAPGTK